MRLHQQGGVGKVEEYVSSRQQIQRMNRIKKENGIPSGFPSLDKITGGWQDPGLTITDFCSKAKRLVKNKRARMIVIDYLHLMRNPKELWRSREDELKHILKELQTTAKELGIPIIVLFQMSKNAYFEQFDLDKSLGYINNYTPYADTVLHRPFVDFPDNVIANGENPNKVRVIVAKNISGEVGETSLLLNTDRASFYTLIPCRRVLLTPLPDSPR